MCFGTICCITRNCKWCLSERTLDALGDSCGCKRTFHNNCTLVSALCDRPCVFEDCAVSWILCCTFRKEFVASRLLENKKINDWDNKERPCLYRDCCLCDHSIEDCYWILCRSVDICTFVRRCAHYLRREISFGISTLSFRLTNVTFQRLSKRIRFPAKTSVWSEPWVLVGFMSFQAHWRSENRRTEVTRKTLSQLCNSKMWITTDLRKVLSKLPNGKWWISMCERISYFP